jgi:hypothetical protein
MAKRTKGRAKLRRRNSAARGKARRVSKSARGKATKRTVATVKPKRVATKKAMRKKEQRKKPPGPAVETVVVDVIEEPAPGVITVTEFEETQIPAGRDEREEC